MTTIVRASHLGFCFGVRDALQTAKEIQNPGETAIYGELVHNAEVNQWLQELNFASIPEDQRDTVPQRSQVMVTAHGISEMRRNRLAAAGKSLIDTTCPLVARVHATALKLAQQNYFVVIIGARDHVEVQGVIEDLPDGSWAVVEKPEDVRQYPFERIGILCQTTMSDENAIQCRDEITAQNPDAVLRWINTICRPTRQRQSAVDALCQKTEMVIVVGGANSNNTLRLVQRCRSLGCIAHHVQSAEGLKQHWFKNATSIGLTAGTSTPDKTIDLVESRIRAMTTSEPASSDRWAWSNAEWTCYFRENLADTPDVPWSGTATLSDAERIAVAESIKIFQLGESGEGNHLLACTRRWIDKGGDPDYWDAVNLFLAEEHVHASLLGRFLRQEGEPLLRQQWSDRCFRFLRHLAGLRTSVSVLVTAEILAQVYYLALMNATSSPVLQAICKRVLRDERSHVVFQHRHKQVLSHGWSPARRWAVNLMERALLEVAIRIVWHDHRSVFAAAEMDSLSYRSRCRRRWHAARRISR